MSVTTATVEPWVPTVMFCPTVNWGSRSPAPSYRRSSFSTMAMLPLVRPEPRSELSTRWFMTSRGNSSVPPEVTRSTSSEPWASFDVQVAGYSHTPLVGVGGKHMSVKATASRLSTPQASAPAAAKARKRLRFMAGSFPARHAARWRRWSPGG